MRPSSVLVAAAAVLACPVAARAQPAAASPEVCAARIHDGVALRRGGRDADALEAFRAAWEGCRQPRARVQMAWAEQALGRWLDAATHLAEALAAPADPWVDERRSRLETDLRTIEAHLGQLEVTGGVAGAEVFVDGQRAGVLPLAAPLRLVVGRVRLEVRRAGYYTVSRDTTIAAGVVAREHVALNAAPEAPVPAAPAAPAMPATPPPAAPVTVTPPRATPTDRGAPVRTAAWVAAAGAGVALVGGVAFAILREDRAVAFNGMSGCYGELPGMGGAACAEAWRDGALYRDLAVGAFVTGAVLGAASGVLFLLTPSRRAERPSRAGLACGAGPGTLGVACGATF